MKSSVKSKIIILITLGIIFAFSPIITTNLNSNAGIIDKNSEYSFDYENLKISKISGKIHIISNSGWVDFKNDGNCTGSGTYSDPYIIEDLIIDGEGSGSCILIENSNVYFRIENCTLYNSLGWKEAGIKLINVNNALLINNTCSFNYNGIYLESCDYNSITKNTVQNSSHNGIVLEFETLPISYCNFNIVSRNIVRNNIDHGIVIFGDYNSVLENTVYNNDQYGLHLKYCDNSIILGNSVGNNRFYGIFLGDTDNNTIAGNSIKENYIGIYLEWSNYNNVTGNILIRNDVCIVENHCEGNIFKNNYCIKKGVISGYNLVFLIGILSAVTILVCKKVMKS